MKSPVPATGSGDPRLLHAAEFNWRVFSGGRHFLCILVNW